MFFDIDISGEDIFKKDSTICVADRNNIILGFKFTRELLDKLILNFRKNKYKYNSKIKSKTPIFKIRLYSIVIYYLFKELIKRYKIKNKILHIQFCTDFPGHDNDIKANLSHFLKDILKLKITNFLPEPVPKGENADRYAYLISIDTKNKLKKIKINLKLKDFEKFLEK